MPALIVTADQLERIVAPLGIIDSFEQLKGGMFATTFKVVLTDSAEYIVKITPADTSSVLTYEHNLASSERLVYTMCQGRSALMMPAVVHSDFTREIVGGDVLIVSVLSGTPWNVLAEAEVIGWEHSITERDRGAYFARLHTVLGTRFGYPSSPNLQGDSWREAFGLMLKAILDDAARWEVSVPSADIWAAFEQEGHHLDQIVYPHLIHMDMWQANVFLDDKFRINGMIDTERALFGDPLFDFVGADQMRLLPINSDQVAGYREQAQCILDSAETNGHYPGLGHINVDVARSLVNLELPTLLPEPGTLQSHEARYLLYRVYFYLLMITEVKPRAFEGDWVAGHLATLHEHLGNALGALGFEPLAPTN